jgi:GrpB-like predicted nucleotidyltransferase (UPF0157 family)
MKIVIEAYDSAWPEAFAKIGVRLRDVFGAAALRIDHIGSTSVPGLSAKNVIDVQLSVASLDLDQALLDRLSIAGFEIQASIDRDHVPAGLPSDSASWAKKYARGTHQGRRVHVHIRRNGAPNQRYALLFRDYLRASPNAAASYALIKSELAKRHENDADAYYDVKDPVCDLIMDAAERWASATRWTPGPSDA